METLVLVLALGWLPVCCRVSSGPSLGLCSSAKIMGLDQLSSEGLTALKLNDVVCIDGKATKDSAFMQAGSTRPSPLLTILQSDKIPPHMISEDAIHDEGEIITPNFHAENCVQMPINCQSSPGRLHMLYFPWLPTTPTPHLSKVEVGRGPGAVQETHWWEWGPDPWHALQTAQQHR